MLGGYERAAERLSASLVAAGHKVKVIAERRDRGWLAHEVLDGVEVRRLWCICRSKLHLLTSLSSYALYLLIRGRTFDVWHVHQYGLHAVITIIISKVVCRPVVLKLTSSAAQGLASTTSNSKFAALTVIVLKQVTAVVALSRETANEAQVFGIPPQRIHILGNGVDKAMFHPHNEWERSEHKKQLGIGIHSVVMFVGRLSPEKNPDGLVTAWKRAVTLLPVGWRLVLVGDGPMYGVIEVMVNELGLKESVILVGEQHNIQEWMSAADMYVISSQNEGLSNSLLEAMASGLPVVATRVSGMTEVVDEPGAGLVVDVGDMNGLVDAMVILAWDSLLREKMGEIGRDVIEQRYAIEAVAARHEELYRQLLIMGLK